MTGFQIVSCFHSSYIKYSQNTTDSFYKEEYDFCENETPNLEEKLEALYKGFAASPSRDALEESYFGAGFFEKYDDYEVYTNPEYLRLSQEEAALLSEYRERKLPEEYKEEIMFRFSELAYITTLFSYMYSGKHRKPGNTAYLRKMILREYPELPDNPYFEKMVPAEDRKLVRMHMKSNLLFFVYYVLLFAYRGFRKRLRKK